MIRQIHIKNYLLVPELKLSFSDGLTVITGETGAGKSILVGSIGLIFGESAADLEAWDPEQPIYLEAIFSPSEDAELENYLTQINAEPGADLILAREISVGGKSAYYIGGRRVAAAVMRELKGLLIDFHHQRDQQKLLSSVYQLEILDRYAETRTLREDFARNLREIRRQRQELEEMLRQQEEQKQRMELYRYQHDELLKADLKTGEDRALQKEYELLTHSNQIVEVSQEMNHELFESEDSIFDRLVQYNSQLQSFRELNIDLENAAKSMIEAVEALHSSSESLSGILDSISFNPARLAEVEARLDLINTLLYKHKVKTVDELQQLFKLREEELMDAEDLAEKIDKVKRELSFGTTQLKKKADQLSQERRIAAGNLATELRRSIRRLALKEAKLEIAVDKKRPGQIVQSDPLSAYTESGQDSVEFRFSANPGSSMKALSAVASGGEMSRILLGIKEVLVSREAPRLLILDEIDSGIGGKTAKSVAVCINEIARRHPVLCITHLAQIAAEATQHIAVEKSSDKKTKVVLSVLNAKERTRELARMLSGKLTDASLKHAEELRIS